MSQENSFAWEVLSLYIYDINEDAVCFGIFKANDDVIYATNAKNSASVLGVNKLIDLRQDKFAGLLHWVQTNELVERFTSFVHERVQRSSLGFFGGLERRKAL